MKRKAHEMIIGRASCWIVTNLDYDVNLLRRTCFVSNLSEAQFIREKIKIKITNKSFVTSSVKIIQIESVTNIEYHNELSE